MNLIYDCRKTQKNQDGWAAARSGVSAPVTALCGNMLTGKTAGVHLFVSKPVSVILALLLENSCIYKENKQDFRIK
jgi:hypothetical protein